VQDGVTYPSTLDASRLKTIFRSLDSDSESTSQIKKLRLHFAFSLCNQNLENSGRKLLDYLRKFLSEKNFRKKCYFPCIHAAQSFVICKFVFSKAESLADSHCSDFKCHQWTRQCNQELQSIIIHAIALQCNQAALRLGTRRRPICSTPPRSTTPAQPLRGAAVAPMLQALHRPNHTATRASLVILFFQLGASGTLRYYNIMVFYDITVYLFDVIAYQKLSYAISYVWYHRYDIAYDITNKTMITYIVWG
jgi:hypothetical protein